MSQQSRIRRWPMPFGERSVLWVYRENLYDEKLSPTVCTVLLRHGQGPLWEMERSDKRLWVLTELPRGSVTPLEALRVVAAVGWPPDQRGAQERTIAAIMHLETLGG